MDKNGFHTFGLAIAVFLGALASACLAATEQPPCGDENAIWANEERDRRVIFYFGERPTNIGAAFASAHIEEWRGSQMAWRQNGLLTCSNGVSTCYVVMEVNGTSGDRPSDNVYNESGTPEASAVFETIDTNNDGLSDWVVLAGLTQSTYYSGGAKVEWFNGHRQTEKNDRILPANIYRFLSCKKQ